MSVRRIAITRSEADIGYLLTYMAFCIFGLSFVEFALVSSKDFERVTGPLVAWSGVREGLWVIYCTLPLAILITAVLASLTISVLFKVTALRVAVLAGLAAVVARHVLFDHFAFGDLLVVKLLLDFAIVLGAPSGVLFASHLRGWGQHTNGA